jgi:hypothetical protein
MHTKILVRNTERKISSGRHRQGLENNFKLGLKETGLRVCTPDRG